MKIQSARTDQNKHVLHWSLFMAVLVVCIAGTLFAWFSVDPVGLLLDDRIYLSIHSTLEVLSTLFGLCVFLISLYTYRHAPNMQLLAAGLTFLAVSVTDLMHVISYEGMPNIYPDGEQAGRSFSFYLAGRLFFAIGFACVAVVAGQRKSHANHILYTLLTLIGSCFLVSMTIWHYDVLSPLLEPDGTLTATGLALSGIIIVFLLFILLRIFLSYGRTHDRTQIVFAAGILLQLFSELAMPHIGQIGHTSSIIGHVFKLMGFAAIFDVFFINGISRPYVLLQKTKEELNAYVNDLDRQVIARTREVTTTNNKLLADVGIAKDIQESFLPQTFPQDPRVRFAVCYRPTEKLSGDFYNIFRIDDSRYGLFIGDVSGHGVSAAMLTIFAFQTIQTLVEESQGSGAILPSFVLKHLYEAFNAAKFSDEHYMVMLYGVYNVETGIFSYASGGLNTLPMRIRPDGSVQPLDNEGYAICKLGDFLKPKFSNRQILLFPGDKLVFFTDGVIEAKNGGGTEFSQERLLELLRKHPQLTAEDLTAFIENEVRTWSDKPVPADDITILAMEILKPF